MDTIINIGQGVKITNIPLSAMNKIKKDLSFPNPQYVSAMKRGTFIPADMPAKVVMYDEDEENNICWIPRGYIFYLLKFLRSKKTPIEIQDHTLLLKPLKLKFLGKLKDYQQIAHNQMMKYPIGVLEASTGSGKTVMGLSLVVKRQQPTLIIVHGKELLYQWRDQIKAFTGEECGLIGDGKFSIKPITVGIINSVSNKLDQLENKFGHIMVDEVHKCAAKTWADVLQEFPAKYYTGLTATAYRNDGLGHAIFASIGPKIHQIDKKMLNSINAVLVPTIHRIETRFKYMFLDDYSTMIKELTNNDARNHLICSQIARDLKVHKETILIVSDRKKHCEIMQKMLLKEFGLKGLILVGGKGKKEREEIVAQVKSGEYKILFSTISLIGEGFDLDKLSCLCLTTPIKFKGRLIQVIGRILRPNKNNKHKAPRVYDFRDNDVNILRNSGFNRDRLYKKEWG